MVTLTIDNRTVTVPEGTTILEAARTARIEIPTMCYLKEINEIGACRLCIVEVEGQERLIPSCNNVEAPCAGGPPGESSAASEPA